MCETLWIWLTSFLMFMLTFICLHTIILLFQWINNKLHIQVSCICIIWSSHCSYVFDVQIFATLVFRCDMLLLLCPIALELLLVCFYLLLALVSFIFYTSFKLKIILILVVFALWMYCLRLINVVLDHNLVNTLNPLTASIIRMQAWLFGITLHIYWMLIII